MLPHLSTALPPHPPAHLPHTAHRLRIAAHTAHLLTAKLAAALLTHLHLTHLPHPLALEQDGEASA